MDAHVFHFGPVEPAVLVPDGVRHAEPAKVVKQTCSPDCGNVGIGQPPQARRFGGQIRHAARVPGELWRLEVGQIGHRLKYGIELSTVDAPGQTRLGIDYRVPLRRFVEPVQNAGSMLAKQIYDSGIVVSATMSPDRFTSAFCAVAAREYLDRTRELHEAGW